MFATRMRASTDRAVNGAYVDEDHVSFSAGNPVTFTNLIPAITLAPKRIVIALAWGEATGHRTVSSITASGVSGASRVTAQVGVGTDVGIFDAVVPVGAAGNLVITFNAAPDLVMASIYNLGDAAYRTSNTDNGTDSVSMSVTTKVNEYVIGVVHAYDPSTPSAFTWTGLTERDDLTMIDNRGSTASLLITSGGSLSVTASSAFANECAGAIAVYQSN